jgi:hypothetical protein
MLAGAAALIRNGRGRANGSVGLVPVDILTVDLLREHQRGQDAERAAWARRAVTEVSCSAARTAGRYGLNT